MNKTGRSKRLIPTPIKELRKGDIVRCVGFNATFEVLKIVCSGKYAKVKCLYHPYFPNHKGDVLLLDSLALVERKDADIF